MGRIHKGASRAQRSELAGHVGLQLLKLRQKYKVTMREVADETGLSNAFISQIENGQSSPSVDTIWKLAKMFDVNPGYFFRGFYD